MECKRVMTGFLICTGLSISAFSQTTGKIIDTKQQPIEGATIVMQLPDSTYLGRRPYLRLTVHLRWSRSRMVICS